MQCHIIQNKECFQPITLASPQPFLTCSHLALEYMFDSSAIGGMFNHNKNGQKCSTNTKSKFHHLLFFSPVPQAAPRPCLISKKSHFWDSSRPLIIQTGRECPSEMGTTALPGSITQALTAQFLWGSIRVGPPRFSSQCFALFNAVTWAQRAGKVWTRICQHRVLRSLSSPRIHAQRSGLRLLNLKNTKNLTKQYLPPTQRLLFYPLKWALRPSS